MTTQEIKAALIEYATEDTMIAIENDCMSICDTKRGVINLNHNNGIFQAFNNVGEELTGRVDRQKMITWLVDQYQVEV